MGRIGYSLPNRINGPSQYVANKSSTPFATRRQRVTIEGSDILEMNHDCIINQDVMSVQGHHIFPSMINASYIPSTNLTDAFKVQPQTFQVETVRNHSAELEALQAQIKLIKDSTLEELQPHDIHQLSIGYVGLLCSITISIGLLWKYYAKHCFTKVNFRCHHQERTGEERHRANIQKGEPDFRYILRPIKLIEPIVQSGEDVQ